MVGNFQTLDSPEDSQLLLIEAGLGILLFHLHNHLPPPHLPWILLHPPWRTAVAAAADTTHSKANFMIIHSTGKQISTQPDFSDPQSSSFEDLKRSVVLALNWVVTWGGVRNRRWREAAPPIHDHHYLQSQLFLPLWLTAIKVNIFDEAWKTLKGIYFSSFERNIFDESSSQPVGEGSKNCGEEREQLPG